MFHSAKIKSRLCRHSSTPVQANAYIVSQKNDLHNTVYTHNDVSQTERFVHQLKLTRITIMSAFFSRCYKWLNTSGGRYQVFSFQYDTKYFTFDTVDTILFRYRYSLSIRHTYRKRINHILGKETSYLYRFWFKNINMFTCFGFRRLHLAEISSPSLEKTLSAGTD